MYSGFIKSNSKVTLLVVLFFFSLSSSASSIINQNTKTTPKTTDKETIVDAKINLRTGERLLLQSIVESFWEYVKEQNKKDPKKHIEYAEIGKIWSKCAIDEFLPKKKTLSEKWMELLIPGTIATITSKIASDKNFEEILPDLIKEIATKSIMVRFFFTPGTKDFTIANYLALGAVAGSAIDFNNLSINNLDLKKPIIKVSLENLKTFIESDKVSLGKKLDEKHIKSALTKTAIVLIKPALEEVADQVKEAFI